MTLRLVAMVIIVAWLGSELTLAIVRRSRHNLATGADRASLAVLWVVISVAVAAGRVLAAARLAALPGPPAVWMASGLAVIVLGLVVRWVAILTLRDAFTVDVAIAADQRVVERGLYGVVRHPSYLGGLISFIGLGLLDADAIALAVMVVPVTGAYLYRMHVEEAALAAAFGEAYADYARRTRRLIPFVY